MSVKGSFPLILIVITTINDNNDDDSSGGGCFGNGNRENEGDKNKLIIMVKIKPLLCQC